MNVYCVVLITLVFCWY